MILGFWVKKDKAAAAEGPDPKTTKNPKSLTALTEISQRVLVIFAWFFFSEKGETRYFMMVNQDRLFGGFGGFSAVFSDFEWFWAVFRRFFRVYGGFLWFNGVKAPPKKSRCHQHLRKCSNVTFGTFFPQKPEKTAEKPPEIFFIDFQNFFIFMIFSENG